MIYFIIFIFSFSIYIYYNINYNLENSTPMIDVPTHEEVLTKKPDYDEVSTPTPQTFDEDCQSKSLDKDNTPSDNLQQGIQKITSKDPSNFKSL